MRFRLFLKPGSKWDCQGESEKRLQLSTSNMTRAEPKSQKNQPSQITEIMGRKRRTISDGKEWPSISSIQSLP